MTLYCAQDPEDDLTDGKEEEKEDGDPSGQRDVNPVAHACVRCSAAHCGAALWSLHCCFVRVASGGPRGCPEPFQYPKFLISQLSVRPSQ
jgi:hypothetical protein